MRKEPAPPLVALAAILTIASPCFGSEERSRTGSSPPTEAQVRGKIGKPSNQLVSGAAMLAKGPDLRVAPEKHTTAGGGGFTLPVADPYFFRVTNGGTVATPATLLKFTCKMRTYPEIPPGFWQDINCEIPWAQVPALNPGKSALLQSPFPALWKKWGSMNQYTIVDYQITATADPGNAIKETSEANNEASWTWQ